MKTILVPIDFSEVAKNAVLYAFGFGKQIGATKIVLYHSYFAQLNVSSDLITPTGVTVDYQAEQQNAEQLVYDFKETLVDQIPAGIEVVIVATYGSLDSNINTVVAEVAADLIVMGITGGGVLKEKLVGSNATSIARDASVPVIIVPGHAEYSHVNRILLASDFVDVELSTPFGPIIDLVNATQAEFFILHVAENDQDSVDVNHPGAIAFLDWLPGLQPEFNFVQSKDFAGAISDFVTEKVIKLVLVIPKKHDLVETLFLENHTKKLAFHSDIPVVAINYNSYN